MLERNSTSHGANRPTSSTETPWWRLTLGRRWPTVMAWWNIKFSSTTCRPSEPCGPTRASRTPMTVDESSSWWVSSQRLQCEQLVWCITPDKMSSLHFCWILWWYKFKGLTVELHWRGIVPSASLAFSKVNEFYIELVLVLCADFPYLWPMYTVANQLLLQCLFLVWHPWSLL